MAQKKKARIPAVPWELDLGARPVSSSSVRFRVWAPERQSVAVNLTATTREPIPLELQEQGYWEVTVPNVAAGSRYRYILDGHLERPDPASRSQPEGVHGPSAVVDPDAFQWTDQQWTGLPLEQFIIYELHTGAFTPDGTFESIIPRLSYLRNDVGVTAIELMPVAQCPGVRNWGYDGVYLFAPQANYGGPDGLKRLVNACHEQGLAVIMDVVYNHLGPEGNYLGGFGPYFTDAYRTPWGSAINYDGPESDGVRHFIVSNAVYWINEYHIDALRLDAVHGIFDFSAHHILQEIGEAVHAEAQRVGRATFLIAESDLNDARVISPITKGGYGLDSQWNDDFHHALHCSLTGEKKGYYEDFGTLDQLVTAIQHRFVYSGQYSPHRRRHHGNSPQQCLPSQFVIYAQNHDQIGNRAQGDRHSTLMPFEALKVSAATVLLSPYIPLLFMGEEYGETAPFQYFIDHGDPGLIEAVRQGRLREFSRFGWTDVPDPYDPSTFERSRLAPKPASDEHQQALLRWFNTLIDLRKSIPSLGTGSKTDTLHVQAHNKEQILTIYREAQQGPSAFLILGFQATPTSLTFKKPSGVWRVRLDAGEKIYGGSDQKPAPPTLDTSRTGVSVELPPYVAWLFLGAEEQDKDTF